MINENIWIELRDGRRLAARLWLPDGARQHPTPAILEYLPYRQRDGTAERDEGNYPAFTNAGYAGVRVDIAGNGDSDGYLADEYLEDELASGEEVIEWIAAQTWCNGAVGMIGISWGGFNGLQIAMRRPPALKAIVTACSTDDRYQRETHYIGGCLLNDNFNWGAQMTALSCRPPDPTVREDWREVWVDRMRRLPFLAAIWLRHQRQSAYWKHGSVCEDWDAIQCSVLAIGGWADSYSDTPAVLAEHLTAPVKALVGPWEHRYPNIAKVGPRGDFHGEVIRWFDRWLKGEQNGVEQLPAYRAYIQEHDNPSPKLDERPGRWVGEAQWPPSTPPKVFHLAPGALATTLSVDDVVICSAQDVGDAAGNYCPGMRVDDELPDDQRRDDEKSVCFDGAPLTEPLEILGAPEVEIAFSTDRPQALLAFRLCDVAPDDSSDRVSFMVHNLTHHAGHERPVNLCPGRHYRIRIPLRHCGHRFAIGNQLRLAVSTAYWPMVWPSPEKATVTLHLENCRLILPQRQNAAGTAKEEHSATAPAGEVSAFTQLRPPACKIERETLADGACEVTLIDDLGETRNPHNGMESGATVRQMFYIQPDDPLSARVETTWEYTLRRGDWRTRVRSENSMTACVDEFRLVRKISAYEGDNVLVLEKTWDEVVPRDCC